MNAPFKIQQSDGFGCWHVATKFDRDGAALADRHYSRRTIGSPQFMPPGETLVLINRTRDALFGWWRPHPRSGIKAMNGLDGQTCSIFRNEGQMLSSDLILEAERLLKVIRDCGPDGMLTYVWDKKVKSKYPKSSPGYCFKMAGWIPIGRSADDRKTLLWKSFGLAGIRACSPHARSPA